VTATQRPPRAPRVDAARTPTEPVPEPDRARRAPARNRRWRPGTAARLAALQAVVLAVVLGGSVIVLMRNTRTGYHELAGRQLVAELRTFRDGAVARAPETSLRSFAETYLRTHSVPTGDAVIVAVEGSGTVGSPSAAPLLNDPTVDRTLDRPPARTVVRTATVAGADVELLVAPLVEGGHRVGTFLATGDLSLFAPEQTRIFGMTMLEAAIAFIVGVGCAFLLLRRLLRTVGRITTTADSIGEGRLHERLGDQGTDDEVGALAQSFDAMLDRVEAAVGAQRRLVSDVSHQLRTPMTVARGHLEVLARTDLGNEQATLDAVDIVLDELDHLRDLVERLSLLGQAMEPDSLVLERVELRTLFADVHDASRVLAPRGWRLGDVPDVTLVADAGKLRGALLNLVDNAVNATEAGARVELSAGVSAEGRAVRMSVGDSGPGIDPAQRAAVLDRFSRPGARDSDGSGLGLAIVRAVAEAHGGRVEVHASRLGGAEVSIIIPREPT